MTPIARGFPTLSKFTKHFSHDEKFVNFPGFRFRIDSTKYKFPRQCDLKWTHEKNCRLEQTQRTFCTYHPYFLPLELKSLRISIHCIRNACTWNALPCEICSVSILVQKHGARKSTNSRIKICCYLLYNVKHIFLFPKT